MIILAIALAAGAGQQQAPDCRTQPVDGCVFRATSTSPGIQTPQHPIGKVSVGDGNQTANMFDVPGPSAPVPPAKHFGVEVAGFYTTQSETFNYGHYVSDGFKASVSHQWTPWVGADLRATVIRWDRDKVGYDPGGDHTTAVEGGPRAETTLGRYTGYVEGLVGAAYQYQPGMTVGGAAGIKRSFSRHIGWTMFDYQYRNMELQGKSPIHNNTMRQREEVSTGLVVKF